MSVDPELLALPAPDLLRWAIQTHGRRFAIVTSFQAEGMVLVDMAARITPAVRVITVDSGRLPQETHQLMAAARDRYRITVEVVLPDSAEVQAMVARHGANLFQREVPLRMLCCEVRKVRPLERKLAEVACWAVGLRRSQADTRVGLARVEAQDGRLKLSPLADWTAEQVERYTQQHDVPRHSLYERGYRSIGCAPCTRPVAPGEDERAGRWWWERDAAKECGIHFTADGRAARQVDVLLEEILEEAQAPPRRCDGAAPAEAAGHRGATLWFTGLSGAGKSTIAHLVHQRLREAGAKVELLDGDIIRTHLSKGLGYSKEDRDTNIRRIGFVCELLARNGVIAIAAAISPYREARDELRSRIPNFIEVHVDCPIDVLVARDVKGLYKRALNGEIANFTGVSDPYEPPLDPELRIDSSRETPEQSAERVCAKLEELGVVSFTRATTVD